MRKLLAGFFLTIRWLLVVLLPAIGLLAGLWLMPATKARWEVKLELQEQCAGVVAVDDARYLALYREHKLPSGEAVHEIIGLGLATGQTGYTRKLPDPAVMVHIQPIPGTTLVMYFNRLDAHAPIRIYDWHKQQDVFQGVVREEYYWIRSVSYLNNVLAADMGGLRQGTLAFWHRKENQQPDETILHVQDSMNYDLQLSPNGAWAIIRYTPSDLVNGVAIGNQVQVIDTTQSKIVQSLPSEIETIRWQAESEAFLALQFDRPNSLNVWQRYIRQDGQFVPDGKPISTMTGIVPRQSYSPFVALATTNREDTVRSKLQEWCEPLGKPAQDMLERLWPIATSFNLFRITDSQLAHRITVPNVEYDELNNYVVHPDVLGQGLVVEHQDKLTCMEFYPVTRWYPRVGLGAGVLLAVGLAWLNLRFQSTSGQKNNIR